MGMAQGMARERAGKARTALLFLLAWFVMPAALAEALPRPPGLAPEVAFWQRIFGEVTTQEALVHDNRYLGVVYEKISLPGSDSASRKRLENARDHYARILNRLASGERQGLGPEEKRVLALWKGASRDQLREAARRVRTQQGLADRFHQGLVRSGRWEEHIRIQLREAGVPESLAALPHVESSFNPAARSHAGAAGLWQFTVGTGRRFMQINEAVDERRDPFRSSEAAARLLRSNYAVLGTWPLAITAYNHGAGGMQRAVRTMGTTDIETIVRHYDGPAFGFASRNFYVSFLAAEEVERKAEQYFGPLRRETPEGWKTVEVPHYLHISSLEQALGVPRETLKAYNPALLDPVWTGRSYVPRGYALRLPEDTPPEVAAERLARVPAAERKTAQVAGAVHQVRPGESLSVIARRYGTTPATLARLNGLSSQHKIRAGQRLKLPGSAAASAKAPASGGGTYVVRRGDNLALIAKRTGVPQRQLMALNDLRNPHRIYPGQRLRLGNGG
jgi:membrane-bound lytic murein transglycosylase D